MSEEVVKMFVNLVSKKLITRRQNQHLKHSHLIIGFLHNKYYKYPGKFFIDDKDLKDFISLYSIASEFYPFSIIETQKSIGPLVIDADIISKKERKISTDELKDVTSVFFKVFKDLTECENSKLVAFVALKKKSKRRENPNNKTVTYKNGFHIYFPHIPLSISQRSVIFDKSVSKIYELDVFKDDNIIDNCNIFDNALISQNGMVMLYGKKPNGHRYSVKHIFNSDLKDINENYSRKYYVNNTSLRKYNTEDFVEYTKIQNLQPDSSQSFSSITNLLVENNIFSIIKKRNIIESLSDPVFMCSNFVKMFSHDRSVDYNKWIKVCWALRNTSNNLFGTFVDFSKRCPEKFSQDVCKEEWESAGKNRPEKKLLTWTSILWWAKEDNGDAVSSFINELMSEHFHSKDFHSSNEIALITKSLFFDSFKCINVLKNRWLMFNGNNWEDDHQGINLHKKINNDIPLLFDRVAILQNSSITSYDTALYGKFRRINSLIKSLQGGHFSNEVFNVCKREFFDKEIENKLDSDPSLLGFSNGVFNLNTRTFKKSEPEDYIFKTVGYPFPEKSNPSKKSKLNEFFAQIQTNKETRNYLLKTVSSCLYGRNIEQKFYIWVGVGSNGKSSMVNLINNTLGAEYSGTMPPTVVSRRRGSAENVTPHLTANKKKRFVTLQETESNDTLFPGQIKELTSPNEKLYIRRLYCEAEEMYTMFRMVLTCNVPPKVETQDEGTWRRLEIIPWNSVFKSSPKMPNEFKINFKFDEILDDLKEEFMNMLINDYFYNDFPVSEQVLEETKRYRKENNEIEEFFSQNITSDDSSSVSIHELYTFFKSWCKSERLPVPSSSCLLRNYISSRYKIKNDKVFGICFSDEKID